MTRKERSGTAFAVLGAVGLCHLLNDMVQAVIPAMYPIIKEDFALTFAQIGVIMFVYQCTSSVLQPLVGWMSDRRARPYSLPVGMTFTVCGMLAVAWAWGFSSMLLAVAVVGCGSAIFHPEASRVAQAASGGKKSLAQSIFQVGGNVGNAVGPLLTALVIIPFGQVASAWFALFALMAAGILMWVGRWYSRWLMSVKRAVQAVTVESPLPRHTVNSSMALLVVLVFSKYIYNACMTSYFTFYLIDKFGLTVAQSQVCHFAYLAAFAAGTLLGGFFGDRYGRKWVIVLSILGSVPFTLAMPWLGLCGTMVTAVLAGLIISSAFSAIVVMATELRPDRAGMVAGIFFGLMFGLGGIGSAVFGWLADVTSVQFIFRLSSWLPLLGVAGLWLPDMSQRKG